MSLEKALGIVEYGIGYDNIDVNAATEKGIIVCNVPDYMTSEVADHAVTLLLALSRRLHQILPVTRVGEWNWKRFRPICSLDGMTAGIVGFGNIGRQVGERLRAFKMGLLAYDPYISSENIRRLGAKPATLQELLLNSDLVSIHVPLNNETRGLIGKRELALMKSSAILVNTSRGAVIDQEALITSLRTGHPSAVGLDVLASEPPNPGDPILGFQNVIITPHISWYSEQSARRLQERAALEAERILTGQVPKHPLNPQVLLRKNKN
jgi:D-3-phosphoglycerate dehydrogenase